jgi:hypothetical protein
MKTLTIAKSVANHNCTYNNCLPSPVHADKGNGDDCSVITIKRSNIHPQTVRNQILYRIPAMRK